MFVSYAKTVEEFRREVVDNLRHDAGRRAFDRENARTKAMREAATARENELMRQADFFERIQFVDRKEG